MAGFPKNETHNNKNFTPPGEWEAGFWVFFFMLRNAMLLPLLYCMFFFFVSVCGAQPQQPLVILDTI